MSQYVDGIKFLTIECCNCGMPFGMTQEFSRMRLNDRESFFCPSGHAQHYTGKATEKKLEEELERRKNELEAAQGRAIMLAQENKSLSSSYSKMRNRIMNGVCPCCNRTFQNLLSHMKTEHSELEPHELLKTRRDIFGLTQTALAKELGISATYVSLYEAQKEVPKASKQKIEAWINKQ